MMSEYDIATVANNDTCYPISVGMVFIVAQIFALRIAHF